MNESEQQKAPESRKNRALTRLAMGTFCLLVLV